MRRKGEMDKIMRKWEDTIAEFKTTLSKQRAEPILQKTERVMWVTNNKLEKCLQDAGNKDKYM